MHDVVGGADDALGLAILLRGVRAGEVKVGAVCKEEVTSSSVIEFPTIVTLYERNTRLKVSPNVGMEILKSLEGFGFEFERKCPQVMCVIIQAYKIIFNARHTR